MSNPRPTNAWTVIGPGLVIAATGVGAGDMVAAAVSGSKYGMAVVWTAALGAILKCSLNEGLARWQLATGQTLLEGWTRHLGRWVQLVFLAYLIIWSFIVAGALISACGLAAHALVPGIGLKTWGVVHSLVAAAAVLVGGYRSFERVIGIFVGVMFVSLVGCALLVGSPAQTLADTVRQASIPQGGGRYVLGVIGGVGGSVTLLSYGYWIREKGWRGRDYLRTARLDLIVAYTLTGIFGVAVVVLASHALHAQGVVIEGRQGVLRMAEMLKQVMGPSGHWTFLVGFWGAVATSMLGVWQGVPYLFCDFIGLVRKLPEEQRRAIVDTRSKWYRGYLFFLAVPPLVLLFVQRPVALIVVYSVLSALFMPFVAATLLYLNSGKARLGQERNGWLSWLLLTACLVLFGYLGIQGLSDLLSR